MSRAPSASSKASTRASVSTPATSPTKSGGNTRPATAAATSASRVGPDSRESRSPTTSLMLSGTDASSTLRSARTRPPSSSSTPDSAKCRYSSSTKNGLPSVSLSMTRTSSSGGGCPASASDHGPDAPEGQPAQADPVDEPPTAELCDDARERMRGVDLVVSVGADDPYRDLGQQGREVFGEQQRGIVRPVQILENQQQWLCLRTARDEFAKTVPQVPSGELRRQLNGWGDVGIQAAQRGRDPGDFRRDVAKCLAQR